MKTAELRKLNKAELEAKLQEAHKELQDAKRSQAAGELVNPRTITTTRRTIARLHTLIKETNVQDKEDK